MAEKPSKQQQIRVDRETEKIAAAICKKTGLTFSAMVRLAVRRLAEQEKIAA